MSPSPPNGHCERWAPLLETWLDGELQDSDEAAGLAGHLDGCPECQADLEALRLLREGVRKIPRPAADARLRESVRSRLVPVQSRGLRQEWMVRLMNRPLPALAVGAVSILLMGAVGLLYANYRSTSSLWPPISAAAPPVEDHIQLVRTDGGSSIRTDDPAELESWFAERLIFPPRVPTWPWADLEGGRICHIKGDRVARIQYAAEGRTFSLFIQFVGNRFYGSGSETCNSGETASIMEKQGYKAAYWSKGGFSYVLVAHQSAEPVFYHLKHEK